MFWGITLESGKKYTQVIQSSFCITMAALGLENLSSDPVSVMVDINNNQYVLCSLQAGKILQQPLNLRFTEGEEVSFFIDGEGEVHLTGFVDETSQDSDSSDNEENEEENGYAETSENEDVYEGSDDYEEVITDIDGVLAGNKNNADPSDYKHGERGKKANTKECDVSFSKNENNKVSSNNHVDLSGTDIGKNPVKINGKSDGQTIANIREERIDIKKKIVNGNNCNGKRTSIAIESGDLKEKSDEVKEPKLIKLDTS